MNPLRRRSNPLLLEIATRPWLAEHSAAAGRPLSLADIPDETLDRIAADGYDAVWLMGAWSTGEKARTLAMGYPDLRATYDRLLPGWRPEDVGGSAYSISAYDPPRDAGGRPALQVLRRRLHERGMGLVLDFVPNHVGIDHAWLDERPDLLVRGTTEELEAEPLNWFRHRTPDGEERIFAHGRDPHFPGWSDTAQIDHRCRDTRRAMTELLVDLASLADGLRCDVAMLVLEDVFLSTWGEGEREEPGDFWTEGIPALRARFPETVLIAEAYWDTQDRLCDLGFDWAYDKDTCDDMEQADPEAIRAAIERPHSHHARRVHFLENHDEARAWAVFGAERSAAAAVALYTLPGLRFFQSGQAEGYRERPPVQLKRYPVEGGDPRSRDLYEALLRCLNDPGLDAGEWAPLRVEPVGENSAAGLVGSSWTGPDRIWVGVANFATESGHGRLRLPLSAEGPPLKVRDHLSGRDFESDRKEVAELGLFVEVPAGGGELLEITLHPAGDS